MNKVTKGNAYEASLHLTVLDELENLLKVTKEMPDGTSLIQDLQKAVDIRREAIHDEYQGKST